MMKTRSRHDAIIRTLRRNDASTIRELALEVGASRRTILRDIGALRDEGFIIHSEAGRGGGLQLDPNSVQATARLAVTEVFALLLAVAAVRAAGSLPFSSLADSGLAKVERALPSDKVRDLRRLLASLFVGKLSPQQDLSDMGTMDSELLPAFEAAFLKRQRLRFQYFDAKGQKSDRDVEPQAMLILPPLWYLVAWDPLRDDFRHFRMDRIRQPVPVDGTWFKQRNVPFDADVCPYQAPHSL
jgi:predicted DNA-binding transcriptional regulator YafY